MAHMPRPQLTVVHPTDPAPQATTVHFAETVRTVATIARRGGLVAPVFRAPPRRVDSDRTIRRRRGAVPVVSIRLVDRPLAAVQSDVIEGVAVANDLSDERAVRFRRAAWNALGGDDRRAAPQPASPVAGPHSGSAQVA